MRQGEVTTTGRWTGKAQSGVATPAPLVLPNPASRFVRTASRLNVLSCDPPLESWLRFLAGVSDAQHVVACARTLCIASDSAAVELSVAARQPPIAAATHARDTAWRDGLTMLLDALDDAKCPPPARAAIDRLRDSEIEDLESLADRFLCGGVDVADTAPTLFVAAALQVYFTQLAASLSESSLRLLPDRGLCPCCGSTPVASVVADSGSIRGARYLYCSLCATAWNHVRAICITCGESRSVVQRAIEGGAGAIKAETCDNCHTYAKIFHEERDTNIDPFADDLGSLGLDLLLAQAGWSRHASNPLLICT